MRGEADSRVGHSYREGTVRLAEPLRFHRAAVHSTPIAFTADSNVLAIPDLASPTLHLLDLLTLNKQLGDVSLGW